MVRDETALPFKDVRQSSGLRLFVYGDMNKGKAGRSLAAEHLFLLSDQHLTPWLTIANLFWAGEPLDEIKGSTCCPLPKDLSGAKSR